MRLRKPFVTTDTNGVFTEKEEEDPQSSSRVDQGAPPEYSPAPRYARTHAELEALTSSHLTM